MSSRSTPESGGLPGRFEFVREPDGPLSVPTDPNWQRFSDVIRSFSAAGGASLARQDGVGTPDAVDHNRGTEEPSCTVGYDLQRFFVDGAGDPVDPAADGMLRNEYNRLLNSHLAVERQENAGGNDDAGVRIYTVVRGADVESAEATLDPSGENPILMELGYQPRKVRSYVIHQPADGTTVTVTSQNQDDIGLDITIENEGATTAETITLQEETDADGNFQQATATTTETFADIDAIWCSDNPVGDLTIEDDAGTVLMESTTAGIGQLAGGLTYSDDDQPVDGDRGVPPLGAGSHADPIDQSYEHFVGDRFERPDGTMARARINSASWAVENDLETSSLHDTRTPAVDDGNRTVTVDADIAGPYASHNSMMEALQRTQAPLVHELGGGIVQFNNSVPTDSAERTRENEQAVASMSETLEASGDPAIEVTST